MLLEVCVAVEAFLVKAKQPAGLLEAETDGGLDV